MKRIFKWGGIGCLSIIGVIIVLGIISTLIEQTMPAEERAQLYAQRTATSEARATEWAESTAVAQMTKEVEEAQRNAQRTATSEAKATQDVIRATEEAESAAIAQMTREVEETQKEAQRAAAQAQRDADATATEQARPTDTPPPTPTPLPVVGVDVVVKNVRWKVLLAENLGNTLISNNQFIDNKTTSGTYIKVRVEIENLSNDMLSFIGLDLRDSQGRNYTRASDVSFFIEDSENCILENLNPGIVTICTAIYEVPVTAEGLVLIVTDLEMFDDDEAAVNLGL